MSIDDLVYTEGRGWHFPDQKHLDKMDTDGRHKWLALHGIKCICSHCKQEDAQYAVQP